MSERKILYEVSVIRPLIIVLLVLMHSFTMYAGCWDLPECIAPCRPYWWIAKVSFCALLETFVFISGYLFASQCENGLPNFKKLVIKKLHRLYLPSVVFSTLCFVLFYTYNDIFETIYVILNGCGHLWFLPMLFWCFIGAYALKILKIPEWLKLVILLCLSLGSVALGILPLRLGNSLYYLLFFYIGEIMYEKRDTFCKFVTLNRTLWLTLLFVLFVVGGLLLKEYIGSLTFDKCYLVAATKLTAKAIQITYSLLGVIWIYSVVMLCINKRKVNSLVLELGKICFGVYIFQQFIIEALYYYTTLPCMLGTYWLPWVGFAVALVISSLLSWLMSKTKVGRFLIG